MNNISKQKNLSIQGLKGIAALMVFFSHALNIPRIGIESIKNSPLHLFFDGQVGVIVFLAISGFFYYKKTEPSLTTYLDGIKRKFLRIYTPYFFVMILGYFLCNLNLKYDDTLFTSFGNSFWESNVSFIELLKQLSVLLPHDTHLINPPTWYIPIEFRLFLVMPLVIMLCNWKYARWWILIPISLLSFTVKGEFYGACAMGSLARVIYEEYINYSIKDKVSKYSIAIVVLAFFMSNITNEIVLPPNISFGIQSIGASILVTTIYCSSLKIFNNRFIVWFGNISYEFYLIHFLVLMMMRSLFINPTLYILSSFGISIALSLLLNKLVKFIYSAKYVKRFR